MKTILILLLFPMVLACNKSKVDNRETTHYGFLPRKCSYISFDNAYRVDMGIQSGISKFNGTYSFHMLTGTDVKAEDYLMYIQTSNYDSILLADYVKSPQYDPTQPPANVFLDEHDINMENQIKEYLNNIESGSLKSSSMVEANFEYIEYRLTELKKLNVTSTSTLFGETPGNLLNNYIEIFSGKVNEGFVFSKDRQLIASIEKGWSIDYYLNMEPIAFSGIYLRMKSVPSEVPVNTKFIIEMEMEGGKILRDTSKLVNLTR